jgi:hypothetical protein
VPWLAKKNAAALERIHDMGRKLSGMTNQDQRELEKNSETGQLGSISSFD